MSDKAPTKALLTLFDAAHVARFGIKAAITGAKDAALMARIYHARGQAETEALIRLFFESRDAFVMQAGFSVGVFSSQLPKLVLQLSPRAQPVDISPHEFFRRHGFRMPS